MSTKHHNYNILRNHNMYGSNGNMYAWLSKMGSYKKTDGVPHTHTKMAGGNLYINDEDYDEFQRLYAKSFDNGDRSMTLSERRSDPVFKMYFDIDILDKEVIGETYVSELVKVIQETTSTFFPSVDDGDMRCVVSTTQPKNMLQKSGETFIKNGIHLTYPFLNVNLEMALQIRFTVTLALEVKLGKREIESNPWTDIIDKAPYFNGLKMCGSVKTFTCPECKLDSLQPMALSLVNIREFRRKHFPRSIPKFEYGKLDNLSRDEFRDPDLSRLIHEHTNVKSCSGCNGSKKQMEDRYYMPVHVVDSSGRIIEHDTEIVTGSTYEAVKWTSVRSTSQEELSTVYKIPTGTQVAPMESRSSRTPNIEKHLIKLSHGLYRECRTSDVSLNDIEGMRHWNGPEITDPGIIEKIRDEIRKSDPHYSNIEVKNVFEFNYSKTKNGTSSAVAKIMKDMNNHGNGKGNHHNVIEVSRSYTIRVGGKGSNYCRNKLDDHTSNTCFFTIGYQTGLKQKCFSRKDILHPGGGVLCSKYSSPQNVKISSTLQNILFKEELEECNIKLDAMTPASVFKFGMVSKKQAVATKKRKVSTNWDALK